MADLALRPLSGAKLTICGRGQTDANDPEQKCGLASLEPIAYW
jgi:hypothetical protein